MSYKSTSTTTRTIAKTVPNSSKSGTSNSSPQRSSLSSAPPSTTSLSSISTIYTTQFLQAPTSDVKKDTTPGRDLGISVGIPICLFLLGLLFCGAYVYFKKKEGKEDKQPDTPPLQQIGNPFANKYSWKAKRKLSSTEDLEHQWFNSDYHALQKKVIPSTNPNNKFKSNNDVRSGRVIGPHILTPVPATTAVRKTSIPKPTTDILNSFKYGTSINRDTDFASGSYTTRQILEVDDTANPQPRTIQPHSNWLLSSIGDVHNKLKTPNKRWRQIGMLTKVDKQYFNYSGEYQCDERSPILEGHRESYQKVVNTTATDNQRNEKHFQGNTMISAPSFLKPQGLSRSKFGDRCDSLQLSGEFKPVSPRATNPEENGTMGNILNSIKSGSLCIITENYIPQLTDEINVTKGEHVRVLATHSDTWCLVEKCNIDGSRKPSSTPQMGGNFSQLRYLNSNRGIVPGKCLAPVV